MYEVLVAGPPGLERIAVAEVIKNAGSLRFADTVALGDSMAAAVSERSPDLLLVVSPAFHDLPFEAVRAVKNPDSSTRVLILSPRTDRQSVIQMLNAGADGHMSLRKGTDKLLEAIRVTATGQRYVCPCCRDGEVERALEASRNGPWPEPHDQVTEREQEVLELIRDGLSPYEIADHLCISPRTAETHIQSARKKLRLDNYEDLVRYLLANDL